MMSCDIACTNPITPVKNDTTCLLNGIQSNCQTACSDLGFYFNSTLRMVACNPWPGLGDNPSGCADENYTNYILDMLNGCMQQYCEAPDAGVGGCPYQNITYCWLNTQLGPSWCAVRIASAFLGKSPSCKALVESVNPDIGGVGLCLLLASTVLLAVLSFPPVRAAIKNILFLVLVMPKTSPLKLANIADQVQVEALLSRQRAVLVSFLVEFQEAQCFFMLASAAACLKALYAGPSYFDATNNIQAFNNAIIFGLICTSGTLPLGFILSLLYTERMASWYITLASAIAILLSSITASRILKWRDEPYDRAHHLNIYTQFSDAARLDKCGSNAPPVILCYNEWNGHNTSIYVCADLSAVSSLLSAIFCIIGLVQTRRPWASGEHAWLRKLARSLNFLGSDRWHPFSRAFILLQQLLYSILSVASIYNFIHFKSGGATLTNDWSIGQIISVTIWAPVICKYIYGSIFGLEGHSFVRFPTPYKLIVTQSIPSSHPGEFDQSGPVEGTFDDTPQNRNENISDPVTEQRRASAGGECNPSEVQTRNNQSPNRPQTA